MAATTQDIGARRRKEEILDVATRLFAERGYEGTSMNDVAARVGMRKASLFYHFVTKDALYQAVLDRLMAGLGSALNGVYSADGSFAVRAEEAADTATTVLGTHPYAAKLLVRESMAWGLVLRGKLLESILVVLEAGAAFVRAGQAAGEFVEGDAKQLIVSSVGAHVLPFAMNQLVERYMGGDVFDSSFLAARRRAVRMQVRRVLVR